MQFRNIDDVKDYLESIPKFQSDGARAADFNLQKFSNFCDAIGAPHKTGNFIHVAGTNGKGSTCRLLASVYQNAGYDVGLYTSPHLIDFNERFVVNGEQITDQELAQFFQENEQQIKQHKLTYFELSTAIAFWWFEYKKVDLAVIEVGLGGRLDATNIISPLVSIITSISMDHTNILGDSIEEIATEKAGIIKSKTPVVLGNLSNPATSIIKQIAAEKKADLYCSSELSPSYNSGLFTIRYQDDEVTFKPGLKSPVQAYNIAVTWQAVQALNGQFAVSDQGIIDGINHSAKLYPNKGRFEKISDNYEWYFDGGHNIEAVKAMKTVVESMKPLSESILVLSVMEDKLTKEVVKEFSEFNKIFYHAVDSNRAAKVDILREFFPDLYLIPAKKELQQKLFKEFESELVIFAGSFYFYSTVERWVKEFATNR